MKDRLDVIYEEFCRAAAEIISREKTRRELQEAMDDPGGYRRLCVYQNNTIRILNQRISSLEISCRELVCINNALTRGACETARKEQYNVQKDK